MLTDKSLKYTKPAEDYYQKQAEKINELFCLFLDAKGYTYDNIQVDLETIYDIITRIDKREDYFSYFHNININEFKRGALTCYWINKLRPFHYVVPDNDKGNEAIRKIAANINESFCCYIINSIIQKFCPELLDEKRAKFSKKFIGDFEYSLRYRDLSKEALILYVEQFLYTHWVVQSP